MFLEVFGKPSSQVDIQVGPYLSLLELAAKPTVTKLFAVTLLSSNMTHGPWLEN